MFFEHVSLKSEDLPETLIHEEEHLISKTFGIMMEWDFP